MKQKITYVCEICKTEYFKLQDAEECEAKHKPLPSLDGIRCIYRTSDIYPSFIEFLDEKNYPVRYKKVA